ncbi:MAG: Transport-associated protein [Schumannella sp.]|nr:Transport-associated protein [Schumannella sp.]
MTTDLVLSGRIRRALERSPGIDSDDVEVQVHAGRVELSGSVGSYAERLSVRTVAAGFADSADIVDAVHVRPTFDSLHVTDDELLESGRAALRAGSLGVALTVTQHVATLVGHVETEVERRRARHAVESVAGMNFVDNQLTVTSEGL